MAPLDRQVLARMTMEQLDALDLCECGQQLSTHPPVRVRAWGRSASKKKAHHIRRVGIKAI